jgi:hypothetical protein
MHFLGPTRAWLRSRHSQKLPQARPVSENARKKIGLNNPKSSVQGPLLDVYHQDRVWEESAWCREKRWGSQGT